MRKSELDFHLNKQTKKTMNKTRVRRASPAGQYSPTALQKCLRWLLLLLEHRRPWCPHSIIAPHSLLTTTSTLVVVKSHRHSDCLSSYSWLWSWERQGLAQEVSKVYVFQHKFRVSNIIICRHISGQKLDILPDSSSSWESHSGRFGRALRAGWAQKQQTPLTAVQIFLAWYQPTI